MGQAYRNDIGVVCLAAMLFERWGVARERAAKYMELSEATPQSAREEHFFVVALMMHRVAVTCAAQLGEGKDEAVASFKAFLKDTSNAVQNMTLRGEEALSSVEIRELFQGLV